MIFLLSNWEKSFMSYSESLKLSVIIVAFSELSGNALIINSFFKPFWTYSDIICGISSSNSYAIFFGI